MTKRLFHVLTAFFALLICIACLPSADASALTPFSGAQCEAAILVDGATGTVLYEQDADKQILPASTTKVMTALLIFEAAERGEITLDDRVAATQSVIDGVMYDASRISPYIADGEIMTIREYLYCMMLGSDCVACDVVATHISGSVENFVAQMNARAAELGCLDTVFKNTHGYPEDGHYTTARALYLMLAQALKYPEFVEIFSTIKYQLAATNLNNARMLYNTDWMIWNPEKITSIYTRYYYEYAVGGKTGSSTESGRCLLSCAQKDGQMLICALVGARSAVLEGEGWTITCFSESERLYEWGFNNYQLITLEPAGKQMASVNVIGSPIEQLPVVLSDDARIVVERGGSDISTEVSLPEDAVKAPVSAGDVMGSVVVSQNGEILGSFALVAMTDAEIIPEKIALSENKSARTGIIIAAVALMLGALVLLYVTNKHGILLRKYFAAGSSVKTGGKNERHDPVLHTAKRKVPDASSRQKAK